MISNAKTINLAFFIIVLFFLSCCGAWTFLFFSYSKIGISWDSVHYLSSAETFYQGKGFMAPPFFWQEPEKFMPLTHYPPLYSFLISCLMHLKLSSFDAAYLLLFILFILNLFLIPLLIYKTTNSRIATLITFCILIVSREFIGLHYAIMSDALFIFLLILFFYALLTYIDNSKLLFLFSMSFIAACSYLSRYIGIVLPIVGFLAIFIITEGSLKKKIGRSFIFILVAMIPLFFWFYRGHMLSINPVHRSFAMNDLMTIYERVIGGFGTAFLWFFPRELPFMTKLFLVMLITFNMVNFFYFLNIEKSKLMSATKGKKNKFLSIFLVIFILLFLLFLLILLSFFESELQFQDRILGPLYITSLLFIIFWLTHIFRNRFFNNYNLRSCILFLISCYTLNCLYNVIGFAKDLPSFVDHGFCIPQWNGSYWNNTKIMNFLQKQEHGINLFSNAPDMIYFFTKKPAYPVLKRKEQEREIDNFINKVKLLNGIVVYFNIPERDSHFVDRTELLAVHNNRIIFEDKFGIVFQYY